MPTPITCGFACSEKPTSSFNRRFGVILSPIESSVAP